MYVSVTKSISPKTIQSHKVKTKIQEVKVSFQSILCMEGENTQEIGGRNKNVSEVKKKPDLKVG